MNFGRSSNLSDRCDDNRSNLSNKNDDCRS